MDKTQQKPLFWYRPCSDGAYEGPVHDSSIEEVRKKSGAWKPLWDHSGGATDMAADLERLRPLADEVQAARHVMREHNRLLAELAASQARERKLRERINSQLERFYASESGRIDDAVLSDALALPQDTSALEAMIAMAGEVMRERFMKLRAKGVLYPADIRALPGVTLEDLK